MPFRLKSLGALILAAGVLLQAYLRLYPYIRTGCEWPEDVEHRIVAFGDPQITGSLQFQRWRKKLDILGNDRFLAQIAESVRYSTDPEYAIVLGDLLSSQWIPTDEFDLRADRYSKIFRTDHPGTIVNVTGNHDIGYHGEFTEERITRYERRFGELNYVVQETPEWRLVVLNSLSLDGPPWNDTWHQLTIDFLRSLEGYSGSTVLATHIPLYKPHGVCRDGPHYDYYPAEQGGGLKQQNHLSSNATDLVLNHVFGDKGGVILAGHDHEGCESSYRRGSDSNQENSSWESVPGLKNGDVQEITVRSIMGEFGGNAGLLSGAFDAEADEIQWTFTLCRFHIQHVWWIAQVLTIIGIGALPATIVL